MDDKTMRVLVTGSRKWADRDTIRSALDIVAKEALAAGCTRVVVVHGCAQGADMIADRWVLDRWVLERGRDWPVRAERHPANWQRWGRAAGITRNRDMVRLGADVCLAFVLDDSRGATQCGQLAEAEGIPTRWFRQYSEVSDATT